MVHTLHFSKTQLPSITLIRTVSTLSMRSVSKQGQGGPSESLAHKRRGHTISRRMVIERASLCLSPSVLMGLWCHLLSLWRGQHFRWNENKTNQPMLHKQAFLCSYTLLIMKQVRILKERLDRWGNWSRMDQAVWQANKRKGRWMWPAPPCWWTQLTLHLCFPQVCLGASHPHPMLSSPLHPHIPGSWCHSLWCPKAVLESGAGQVAAHHWWEDQQNQFSHHL